MARYGIDLGTTYSSIARYDPNRKLVEVAQLNTSDGGQLLRSLVFYPEGGQAVVGEAAMNAYWRFPDRVFIGVKQRMGDLFETPPIDGKRYTPAEVSSEILKVLKADGEVYFGEPVEDVVITVPAFFGSNERRDTEEAGEMAGLNVIRLLEEPSAAALAFAVDKIDQIAGRNILVYDLGGGTFDVALIHCEREEYETGTVGLKVRTICLDGNRRLGGLNWDQELERVVAERCLEQFEHDPRVDAADNATLIEQSERGKRHLSRLPSVSIAADLRGHTVEITRSEFEEATAARLRETRFLLENVLQKAENPSDELREQFLDILPLRRDQIEVLLCGGATRMPSVEALIEEVMGRPPLKHGNPDALVSMGAAYAAYLSAPSGEPAPVITAYDSSGEPTDIMMPKPEDGIQYFVRPVGIRVLKDPDHPELGAMNSVVIPGGAAVGVKHKGHFAAAFDGQVTVELRLLEGDDPDPDKCVHLDSFMMHTDKPGRPKGWGITVELMYDDSAKIVGTAVDDETEEEMEISYERRPQEAAR